MDWFLPSNMGLSGFNCPNKTDPKTFINSAQGTSMAPSTVVPRSTLCCRCVSCSAKTVAFFGGLQPQHVEGTSGDPRGFWVNLSKPSWFRNLNQGHWSSLWPAPARKDHLNWGHLLFWDIYPHHHLTWGREVVITFTQQFDAWELGFCAPAMFGGYDNWDI